ncbi:MAG: NYN domain-containing protein [Anaerolineae bacterium]|nr:NYN domain-containing protein [Anaerolineae bacterium]
MVTSDQEHAEVVAVVDRYQLYEQNHHARCKATPQREAQTFKLLVGVFGQQKRLVAIVHEDDAEAIQAYGNSGYEVHTMNGDRPQALPQFLAAESRLLAPKHLVVVSDEAAFGDLCTQAAQCKTHVMIWSPSGQPAETLTNSQFETRALDELWPQEYLATGPAFVWLDIENLLIGLKQQGLIFTIADFVSALKTEISDLGEITGIVAYGDYGLLRESFGFDVQRELEQRGVRTRYQMNLHGKNSADMEIASDIHTYLEHQSNMETVVIGTGDRDFRPAVDTAHAKGKRVVLLALKDSLSRELQRAADEVRYLDKRFVIASLPVKANSHETGRIFLLRFIAFLKQQQRQWVNRDHLPADLATMHLLAQAIQDGLLLEQHNNGVSRISLNVAHPLVHAAEYAAWWIPQRVAYLIQEKGMPYVDTSFLAKGMQMDQKCRELGIGQDRAAAAQWLDVAAAAGLVLKARQRHPNTPDKMLDIWLPVGYLP